MQHVIERALKEGAVTSGDAGAKPVAAFGRNDLLVIVIGTIAYGAFAFLHESLIGVAVR
mgnify:CR=1 FL=1